MHALALCAACKCALACTSSHGYVLAGGLAAPAIAAGIGAAISLVGGAGAAAAAASASGFLATAAGTAATAAGVGVAGGSFAGSRMARRVGACRLGFRGLC